MYDYKRRNQDQNNESDFGEKFSIKFNIIKSQKENKAHK